MSAVDILILSNGPGELATWVQPVVKELRRQLGNDHEQVRISLVLSPCTNASGREVAIARRYSQIDRIQAAEHFFPFLLFGKTSENWDWRNHGVVIFLGGDQLFPVVIGKRLGYRTVVYAEWDARWHGWIDRFGVMKPEIAAHVSQKHAHKFSVVGDLMAEAGRWEKGTRREARGERHETEEDGFHPLPLTRSADAHSGSPHPSPLIGILPGSKPMKLTLGVPLMLAIAAHIHQARPDAQFVIPVAPTLELATLAAFADPRKNPVIQRFGWMSAELASPENFQGQLSVLKTPSGMQVTLWTEFPAYDILSKCDLCLTTIGANTAELGALAVPMVVVLPTQQLDVMRAWDGLPGLLVNLPGVGSSFAKAINWFALRRVGLLAWPNIWAKREIVPELVGELQPKEVAALMTDLLDHPEKLQQIRTDLQTVRGQPGAAEKLVELVCEEMAKGGWELGARS